MDEDRGGAKMTSCPDGDSVGILERACLCGPLMRALNDRVVLPCGG